MADDFVSVNRNVFVNVRHRQFLHVFICQPRREYVLRIFVVENVRTGVAVETGRLAEI